MSATCRSWLTACLSGAPPKVRQAFKGAAVLGDRFSGYTVELANSDQIYVGRTCCKYCARAEALVKLEA